MLKRRGISPVMWTGGWQVEIEGACIGGCNRKVILNIKKGELQEITEGAIGIHVLPSRSLFGHGILRRLLLRVSLAKPTSAPLRC
jgi:hypothetical protein